MPDESSVIVSTVSRPFFRRASPSAVLRVLVVVFAVIAACCAVPIAWNSMFASRGSLKLQSEFVHEHLASVFVREQRLGVVAFFAGIAMLIAGSVARSGRGPKENERKPSAIGVSAASLRLLVAGGVVTTASLFLQPGSDDVRDAQKVMATATRNDQRVAARNESGMKSEIGSLLAWTQRLEELASATPCPSRCGVQVALVEIIAEIKRASHEHPDARPGFEKVLPRINALWRALDAAVEGLGTDSGAEMSQAERRTLLRPSTEAALVACRAWRGVHLTPPKAPAPPLSSK